MYETRSKLWHHSDFQMSNHCPLSAHSSHPPIFVVQLHDFLEDEPAAIRTSEYPTNPLEVNIEVITITLNDSPAALNRV